MMRKTAQLLTLALLLSAAALAQGQGGHGPGGPRGNRIDFLVEQRTFMVKKRLASPFSSARHQFRSRNVYGSFNIRSVPDLE